jgi:uncharacterized membrane protein YciS (DUF1049 family)
MTFVPFNLFREEILLEVLLLMGTILGSVVLAVTLYALKRLHDWNSTRHLKRVIEKEDALKNASAHRIWHENRR